MSLDARIALHRADGFALDVTLELPAGRTVALLGPNGAGKSTVVATIAGLLPIEAGWIRLSGRALDEPSSGAFVAPEDRRIGVVFQDYLLFDHLSVIENVAFGLRARGLRRRDARARAMTWLERLGVATLAERRPRDLSGGEAQRVALARALACEPDVLLLDEPLASLDVSVRGDLRRALAEHLAAFEGPRLLITHEPSEAFGLGDDIAIIEAGTITQTGGSNEIRRRPRTAYAADLSASNLLEGMAGDGVVTVGTHRLLVADHSVAGPITAVVRASAVAVHRDRPEGSPRNAWPTTIEAVEPMGDRARLLMGAPLPLTVEVTVESVTALRLAPGESVWVSIKATDIDVEAVR